MIHRFGKGVLPFLFVVMTQVQRAAAAEPIPAELPPVPAKAARAASEILFKDDFERPGSAIDPSKWRVSKTKETDVIEVRHNAWPNTGGFAVITDSGDQGGSYRGWAGAIASQRSFSRGRNLRCTFKVAMPAHSGAGFSGPWHSTNVMTHQKYSMVHSMTGSIGFYCNGTYQPPHMEWDENNHDVDKNLPANGYLSGPRLAEDFLRAWRYSCAGFRQRLGLDQHSCLAGRCFRGILRVVHRRRQNVASVARSGPQRRHRYPRTHRFGHRLGTGLPVWRSRGRGARQRDQGSLHCIWSDCGQRLYRRRNR